MTPKKSYKIRIRLAKKLLSVNFFSKFENWYPAMSSSEAVDSAFVENFTLQLNVFIREQQLFYRCDAWELLKWGWVSRAKISLFSSLVYANLFQIQYLAILVIVKTVFQFIDAFLYENHIFDTIVTCGSDDTNGLIAKTIKTQ